MPCSFLVIVKANFMPEESRANLLNLKGFHGDIRQGLLQFSRTEQGGLENCNVGGAKRILTDECFSKADPGNLQKVNPLLLSNPVFLAAAP
jgi:hypothetical protein